MECLFTPADVPDDLSDELIVVQYLMGTSASLLRFRCKFSGTFTSSDPLDVLIACTGRTLTTCPRIAPTLSGQQLFLNFTYFLVREMMGMDTFSKQGVAPRGRRNKPGGNSLWAWLWLLKDEVRQGSHRQVEAENPGKLYNLVVWCGCFRPPLGLIISFELTCSQKRFSRSPTC